jgi:hypothetical protein
VGDPDDRRADIDAAGKWRLRIFRLDTGTDGMRDHRARSSHSDATAGVLFLTQPSERVQAELFAEILRREIAAMRKKAAKAEVEWQRRCESEGYIDPPERLVAVRERLDEVDRMLKALRARFLRST